MVEGVRGREGPEGSGWGFEGVGPNPSVSEGCVHGRVREEEG